MKNWKLEIVITQMLTQIFIVSSKITTSNNEGWDD